MLSDTIKKDMTTDTYLILAFQVLSLIGYFLTARYQSKKIDVLESNLNSQSNLLKNQSDTISTFEKYKEMVNLKNIEDNLNLKIENLHLEYKRNIELGRDKVINEAVLLSGSKFKVEQQKMLRAWTELINITAQVILDQYPHKTETDEITIKFVPFNAEYIIGYMDAWSSGELEKYKANHPLNETLSTYNTLTNQENQTPKDDQTSNQNRPV
jgi:hypothetical protein